MMHYYHIMLQRPSHAFVSKIKLSPYKSRIARLILKSNTEWPAPPDSQRQKAGSDTVHVKFPISPAVLSNRTLI